MEKEINKGHQKRRQPTPKEQKAARIKRLNTLKSYLVCEYPQLFTKQGSRTRKVKMLALSVYDELKKEILEGKISKDEKMKDFFSLNLLRKVLKSYTHSLEYLQACKEGEARYTLDGRLQGKVSARQEKYALKVISTRVVKPVVIKKKKQKKKQRIAPVLEAVKVIPTLAAGQLPIDCDAFWNR